MKPDEIPAKRPVWRSVHTTIEAPPVDRETGRPHIELVMRPMGTFLPAEEQQRELDIRIGTTKTILNEEGMSLLRAFLDEDPRS